MDWTISTGAKPGAEQTRGWLLYDETCGFCTAGAARLAPILGRHRFSVVPLGSEFARRRVNLPETILRQDFRLLLADGSQFTGSEAYRQLMRRVPWAFPLYLLVSLPGLRWVFDAVYRRVARERFRFSQACRCEPRQK